MEYPMLPRVSSKVNTSVAFSSHTYVHVRIHSVCEGLYYQMHCFEIHWNLYKETGATGSIFKVHNFLTRPDTIDMPSIMRETLRFVPATYLHSHVQVLQ